MIVKTLHCSNQLIILLDALCCCQANDVPELCLGFCMGQDAEGNTEGAEKDDDYDVYETYNGDDEKNDTAMVPPFWFVVKQFLSLLHQSFRIMFINSSMK